MRRFILMMITLLISISTAQSKQPLHITHFYQLKNAGEPTFSADRKYIVYVVSQYDSVLNREVKNLWLGFISTGTNKQITFSGTSNHSPVWAPDSNVVAYVSDSSGCSQIWTMTIETGKMRQLTDIESGAWAPCWSPDGKKIAFLAETKFEGRHPQGLYDIKLYTHLRYRWWYDDNRYDEGWRSHIFIIDVSSKEVTQLTSGDAADDEIAFSPDGKYIAFVSNRTPDRENNIDTDIWLVPTTGGEILKVFENQGPDEQPVWSKSGKYIAWRSTFRYNYESDNYDIIVKDLKKGEVQNLTTDFDRVVRNIKWHPKEKEILFTAGDRGNYNLYSIALSNKKVKPLIERDQRIRSWDLTVDDKNMVLAITTPVSPAEIFLTAPGKKTMKRFSCVNDELLEAIELPNPVAVSFMGDNNTEVFGWYLPPPQFDPQKKYPLILNIHGGPQGMYKNEFDFEFQATAAQGYIVFYLNPRGSFGYGQQFTDEINQDYGGICYRDIMAGVDYMISLGFVDESRMGVTGLSFGGWMTSWIIGHTDRFKAAIPVAPFVNMFSFYGTTDEQFFPEWDFGGQPYSPKVRAIYEKNSPLNYAQNFKTPTLIIHGEADWRCHISEGEQLFTALKKMGVPATLARVPDEAHVFTQPRHIEATIRMKLDWWAQYLK